MNFARRLVTAIRARGGLRGSLRVFMRKLGELGLTGAVMQLTQTLLLDSHHGAVRNYRQWFNRNGQTAAQPATALFEGASVLLVGAMDIPQCRKYRLLQKLEYFRSQGIPVELSDYLDCNRVLSAMQLSTHVLFYRIPMDKTTAEYFAEARRLGLHTIYDIDDPIFDHEVYSANSNLSSLAAAEREHLLRSTAVYLDALQQADSHVVSTSQLAALLQEHTGTPPAVWPNLLDAESMSVVEGLTASPPATGEECCIAYMSGSRAHDNDFAVAARPLAKILGKHPQVKLILGGHFSLPDCLADYSDRISTLPYAGYAAYFEQLQRADINIVPLVIDRFNACKSAIRYLETAVLGVPTVASEVGEFTEAIDPEETGFLAADEDDWFRHLDRLVGDAALRERVGSAAREQVLKHYVLQADHPRLRQCMAGLGIEARPHSGASNITGVSL
jgi:glycosyltransferase involved in cell wall biosynthesis